MSEHSGSGLTHLKNPRTFMRYKLLRLIAIFCFGVSLSITATAHAATYYVSVNGGSDSNPGTEAAPFKTIARGSQKMSGGDTLLIRAGTYNEVIAPSRNGMPGAYTRYAAYPGEEVIVKAPPGTVVVFFSRTTTYVEVSDLIIDGTNATSYAVKIEGSYEKDQWPRIRLLRNDIRFGRFGIGGGGESEIIGNKIHHMKGYGIYTAGHNGLLEGNIFHDNGGYAIHHYQKHEAVNNWIIRNNVIYRNGDAYYPWYRPYYGVNKRPLPAVTLSSGRQIQFYNNLVYNNPNGGVTIGSSSRDVLLANNTIYKNGEYGVFDRSSNARIINNISWGNSGAQILNTGANTTLQNNLTTDPKFVNPAAGNFGIQAGSPALDKGITVAQVPDDFTGKKRPEGAAYDIGAFEGAGSKANVLPGMAGGLPAGGLGGAGGTGGGGLGSCYK